MRHTKGKKWAGRPFLLEPWQKKHIRNIFGTLNTDGNRQYRTVYFEVPRKNGKSELAAAIGLYLLFADDEPGAEIYSAACDTNQATIVFDIALGMVWQEPELAERCKIYESTKRIAIPEKDSFYRVLSAEHKTKHGFNAHGVIFDELHGQPNRELWDVLTTSGGTRTQPLTFAITTAGYDQNSICYEQHKYAEDILNGIAEDPTFYPVIFSAPKKADWTDEKVWHKCNPALGSFRDIREMRSLCNKAKLVPALQNTFRRLYLNQWTSQRERWLDIAIWDASAGEVYEEDLRGEIAYGGLDLASTVDIASLGLVFPDDEDCYDLLPKFWIPEDGMRERSKRDGVPYETWVEQGLITATPGNVIDYRWIRKDINEFGEKYHIKEIAFDRWGATELIQYLEDDGFTLIMFVQGFSSFAMPTKELLALTLAKRIRHGGNPVLRWMADNMVVKQDPAGNLKPDKEKAKQKIDGIVAMIMGLDRAIRNEGKSVYETRGLRSL